MSSISVWNAQLWSEEARAPLLHLLNLHHVDSGAVSDVDKFISIMHIQTIWTEIQIQIW